LHGPAPRDADLFTRRYQAPAAKNQVSKRPTSFAV
jgi:hypothetical protein